MSEWGLDRYAPIWEEVENGGIEIENTGQNSAQYYFFLIYQRA